MYKALFTFFIVCLFFLLLLRTLKKKHKENTLKRIMLLVIILSIIGNCLFNFRHVFPAYYLYTSISKEVGYEWRKFGDMEYNLFSYSEEHIFPDQIIFQVLKDRHILLDNSQSNFYDKFLNIYAGSVDEVDLPHKETKDFSFSCEFSIPMRMDYAMEADWEYLKTFHDNPPSLFIRLENVKGNNTLNAFADENNNLYIY